MSRLIVLLMLFSGAFVLAEEPAVDDSPDEQPVVAPIYFERLINSGTVALEFYEPNAEQQKLPGQTKFDITFQDQYEYEFKWTANGNRKDVAVTIDMQEFDVTVRHQIRLPRHLDRPGRWQNSLTRHEFDHVAISTDPRAQMLLDHLGRGLRELKLNVPDSQELNKGYFNAMIDKELAKRHQAVIDLVQYNYDELDKFSKHGIIRLPNRREFFRQMYKQANLAAAKFPYQDEVKKLLADDAYKNAKLLYKDAPNF